MDVAATIETNLRARGDPERAANEKRYLKSALDHFGTDVPTIRATVRDALGAVPDTDDAVTLALSLWERPVHECRMAAVEILRERREDLDISCLPEIERMLRGSKTWALVDPLAIDVVGSLFDRHAIVGDRLDRWATDADFWLRRAAMLSLLRPLRQGEGDFARFSRYADEMLDETEFFIRKAIGWVLRERAKKRPDDVYRWVKARAASMSGVTFREAVRSLPDTQRGELASMRITMKRPKH